MSTLLPVTALQFLKLLLIIFVIFTGHDIFGLIFVIFTGQDLMFTILKLFSSSFLDIAVFGRLLGG